MGSGSIGEGVLVDSVVRASERQRSREHGVFDVFRRCPVDPPVRRVSPVNLSVQSSVSLRDFVATLR